MLADGRIGVGEDHALPGHLFLQRAVDHFALVLGLDAGEELLLGLGDAQPVEGGLDLAGHVVPRLDLPLGRFEIVVDVLELDADVAAPAGHGLALEDLQALQAELAHPRRLALHLGDFGDDFLAQSLAGLEHVPLVVAEVVFIDFADRIGVKNSRHEKWSLVSGQWSVRGGAREPRRTQKTRKPLSFRVFRG